MFWELMGICFSCRRPTSGRLNSKISEHISASVTPLHVCLEEQRRPELGSCDASQAHKPQVKRTFENQKAEEEIPEEVAESDSIEVEAGELRQSQPSMANTISNMKMTNPIKGLVSKRRKRFTEDGFDLDLTSTVMTIDIKDRNHIDDVVKLLESKHKDHYKIYNLCSERSYDCKKFKQRVATYAFDDHNPPKLEQIKPFCEDVQSWLSQDKDNVAAVHCKAGKGRTGVMVCCYLLHSKQFPTATEALNYYGTKRTHDRKGVTIPSQRRYVDYYATLLQEGVSYEPVTLLLRKIQLDPAPIFNGGQGCLHFVISESNNRIFSDDYEVRKGTSSICIPLQHTVALRGDIRVEFYNYKPKTKRKEKMFHFWFNTFFVREKTNSECDNGDLHVERSTRAFSCDGTAMELPMVMSHAKPRTGSLASLGPMPPTLVLRIDKSGLDKVHKDKNHKLYSPDFKRVSFIYVPSSAEAEMLNDVKNLYRFLDGSIIRFLGYDEVNIDVGMDKVSVCRASHRSLDTHQTISSQRRKPHLRRQNRPMSNPSLLPHHKNTKLRLAATSPISNSIIYTDVIIKRIQIICIKHY
ncbi:Phosphatidylinositol-3,4,5-trisphosphate 3-phosphatase and dual-specificity protein phosphatase PTEN [Trachymyrmex zeteki]|uniref:Phosphatidylinositol 3,4,5-trisphosphate 3-phosphatase and dual-specificity protein phosphatase PTEN n=1 Tax=Mycetomoellerius zeteki TaxID=64791 RepID=A0A151XDA8_9HYME|nr:Phosphatidylinositol-3,4,5-trisphosphate 3-phosphatase and dual-specificity protein phosphatase PTEN [Trachymyrmex zeteki]